MKKLIITLAPTGNVPTKSLNPNTPITASEIVADIKKCMKSGVSLAHIHARDNDGNPTHSKEVFKEIIDLIHKKKLNVITQLSTGARGGANNFEMRSQMLDLDVEMASLATGSSNFATSINSNPPEVIEAMAIRMTDNNIKPEIEAFDVGMISNAKRYLKRGILKGPIHFNLVMGVPGSIEGSIRALTFMVDMLPANSSWSVCGIGATQVPMITAGILLGGHVRTGLEDTILYKKGQLATNTMLVERVARIAKELGREIATTDEAREILSL